MTYPKSHSQDMNPGRQLAWSYWGRRARTPFPPSGDHTLGRQTLLLKDEQGPKRAWAFGSQKNLGSNPRTVITFAFGQVLKTIGASISPSVKWTQSLLHKAVGNSR